MRIAILSVLLAFACAAETSVAPPLLGHVRDCNGRVRQVFGAAGAFLLGPPQAAPAARMLPAPKDAKIEGRALILRDAAGLETRVQLPESAGSLQRMGSGWLAAPPFAIKLTAAGAVLYRLPMQACAAPSTEDAR